MVDFNDPTAVSIDDEVPSSPWRDPAKAPFRDRTSRRRNFELAAGDEVLNELVYRVDVWERDGGICQVCMSPIPPEVGRRGRLSFDIDHIDPCGDHVLSNLRATHSFCNQSKNQDGFDPEVLVARARLAVALAKLTPKRASIRYVEDKLQSVAGPGQPGWWRVRARRAWRQAGGGSRVAERNEYLANVQRWADALPQEIERYLAWADGSEEGSPRRDGTE